MHSIEVARNATQKSQSYLQKGAQITRWGI